MIILIAASFVGFIMSMAIGANDVANSMATSVGSKAITIKQAVIIAGIFEFAGALFLGKMVTETVRKGIVDPSLITEPKVMIFGAFAALLSATFWIFIATRFSIPISTTHSIVGGMAGFGIAAAGWDAVNWTKMLHIALSWIFSPVLGGLLAFAVFKFISLAILHKKSPLAAAKKVGPLLIGATFFLAMFIFFTKAMHRTETVKFIIISLIIALIISVISFFIFRRRNYPDDQYVAVEGIFKRLQIITACYVSLAHGSNDVANAIGPLAAIYSVVLNGAVASCVEVPKWLLMLGGLGIVIGVSTWGHKVMRAVGEGITTLNNSRGFSVNFATASTVFLASIFGIPISSSHIVVGSVTGVGLARGFEALNMGFLGSIVISWILTVPCAALSSALIFKILIAL